MKMAVGLLPSPGWLQRNGYAGLVTVMQKSPEAFAHIPQDRVRTKAHTPEEWRAVAEKLAEEHGGVLPGYRWLTRQGYRGLAHALYNHPQLFAHIRQPEKTKRTPEEWVAVAERLAGEHGGVLPGPQELPRKGYRNLPDTMRLHPQLFAHIGQHARATRAPKEWVGIAERLAGEHGATLPGPQELRKKGYRSLPDAMRLHPQLFAHIRQCAKPTRTSEADLVRIAERLAAEHGGTLPGPQRLQKLGCRSLYGTVRRCPELFAHVTQMKRFRRPHEWVPVAETLAQKHGELPGKKWLERNGYNGLRMALRRRPELFEHIPQHRYDSPRAILTDG